MALFVLFASCLLGLAAAQQVGGTNAEVAPPMSEEAGPPFCCLASRDPDGDFCGGCFPNAKVFSPQHCGTSWENCQHCGGHPHYCDHSDSPGLRKPSPMVTGGGGDPLPESAEGEESALSAPEYDCEAGAPDCENSWTSGKKSYCAKQGRACPPAEQAGPFCCMASQDPGNFCNRCFEDAKVFSPEHCGRDPETCRHCGENSEWCGHSDSAGLQQPDLTVTDGGGDLQPESAEGEEFEQGPPFCCLASRDPDGDFCGGCFPNAQVFSPQHCGTSWENCRNCGGHPHWCDHSDGPGLRKPNPTVTDGEGDLQPESTDGKEEQRPTKGVASDVPQVVI